MQGFLAKWTGFSCEVDVVFLQSGRGFLAKWTGFSCKADGVFLCIAKVKSFSLVRKHNIRGDISEIILHSVS